MPAPTTDLRLAHVLFIDIVGSSKLLINEQSELLRRLGKIIHHTSQVRDAEAAGKLIRLPTGDGMALAFFTSPDAPVRCAMEIATALKNQPEIPLRMGINSGPVDEVIDVSGRSNIAGAGITIAQRVMDCGDAGHVLLSKRIADDLAQYADWRPHLHSLGECEVKHGQKIDIYNLYTDEIGNPATPEKINKAKTTARPPRIFLIPVAALLILIAGIIGFVVLHSARRSTASTAPAAQKRIAVLPFKPLLPENRDQVLELGMADSLIAKLSNSREIIVSSLNAVRKYTGLDQDSLAAGRELHVDSVLEGNVQKMADRIRVSARLIKVTDGSSLWAGTFDEKFTNVFAVQDAISQKVADALALRLSAQEKNRLTKRYTDDLDAYQLYLTGRYHYTKLIPSEIRTAIEFFQKAIERDPNYAMAYFGLAEANRSLAITSDVPSKEVLPRANEAAMKALALDDGLAEAHASLSFTLIWYNWDWKRGEDEARHAVALNPNSGFTHFALAHVLSDLARHDEALAEAHRAAQLEPVFLLVRALEGMFLLHAGRDDEAMSTLQKALDLDPNFWITHLMLGKVYTQQRKLADADDEFEKAKELSHGNSEAIASIAYVAALADDNARARSVLAELQNSTHYIPPVNIALAYNGLGDQEKAMSYLEKACDERDVRLTLLKVEPRWHNFRSNPRFIAVLKRVGLQ